MRGKCRDRNAADFLQREIGHHEFDDIRQLDDNAIQILQPQVQQVQGEAAADVVNIPVGVGMIAIPDRDAIPIFAEDCLEFLRERFVEPIAFFPVFPRKFRGKWNYTFKHADAPCGYYLKGCR